MKRDMDFVRDLLLRIEGGEKEFSGKPKVYTGQPLTPEVEKLSEHLRLLKQAGYIDVQAESASGFIMLTGLSWKGHDFLDSVRSEDLGKDQTWSLRGRRVYGRPAQRPRERLHQEADRGADGCQPLTLSSPPPPCSSPPWSRRPTTGRVFASSNSSPPASATRTLGAPTAARSLDFSASARARASRRWW